MKKYGLLFFITAVFFALFSACNTDDIPANAEDDSPQYIMFSSGDNNRSARGSGLFSSLSSTLAVAGAVNNNDMEFSQRISSTPFQVFGMLADSLKNGTTTLNFTHNTEVSVINGGRQRSTATGNISLQSDSRNADYALTGDLTVDGEMLDFSAYINNDRIAVGSNLIGGTYGVDFDTFAEDFERFRAEFGIDTDDLGLFANMTNEYIGAFNDSASPVSFEQYVRLLVDFQLNNEQISENIEVTTSAGTINARRVSYTFTDAQITHLLRDLVNTLENDTAVSALFNSPLYDGAAGDSFSEIIRELRNIINDAERQLNGNTTVSYYIGPRDRLVRMDMDGFFNIYGEQTAFNIIFDFGASATDTWRMDTTVSVSQETVSIEIIWDIRETDGRYTHDVDVVLRGGGLSESAKLTCDWNPSSGEFTISLTENGWYEELLRGNFTTSGSTFNLSFNISQSNVNSSYDIAININTTRGTNIGPVEYTHFADITISQFEALFDGLFGLGYNTLDWD